ncbi:MAG: heparin-sulfate lyase HepC [Pedobacter sp.]|uniref:heparin-sulfate lyase HepC n=1 Tax=Pedobacter sp. TaxID=1411316 RepID=UPI003562B932
MNLKKIILLLVLTPTLLFAQESSNPVTKESFNNLNLNYPGLEEVNKLYTAGKYTEAATQLLKYYRSKPAANKKGDKAISAEDQEKADNALLHKFKPQKGYGFFDYGKDINWSYWPVKDNEVRWQLHRVYWWQPMGLAYRNSGDEKYAKEWVFQFRDWVRKNPLGLSAENDRYAWRPLEISERIQSLVGTFNLFVNSPNFSPAFLMEFLKSYHQQTDHLSGNFAAIGNHRLFEAQRTLTAGANFPEYKNSEKWRKIGIEVLNAEIVKQVYPDGLQFELSPNYHNAAINIFLNAYNAAKLTGVEKEFPSSYKNTVENMIMATINFSFPDYTFPMFGDAWIGKKKEMIKQYNDWSKAFPDNKVIQYYATDGKKGTLPNYLSKGLTTAGFYSFRNGWADNSTVMVLKASPPGKFHAQPDNGTFELWVKGRNFTPDAGVYVYSGDEEIMKKRNWFRQTRVHNTLTLNDENMIITKAKVNKWSANQNLDVLSYINPSYNGLDHQRSVLFIDQKYFVIIDLAMGKATGKLDVRFHLKEDSKPVYDKNNNRVTTSYDDGNNLLIQSLNTDKVSLLQEQTSVSYFYNKEIPRPALAFEKQKADDKTQAFVTVVYPFDGQKAPKISIKENNGNDYIKGNLNISLTIDGKKREISAQLTDK